MLKSAYYLSRKGQTLMILGKHTFTEGKNPLNLYLVPYIKLNSFCVCVCVLFFLIFLFLFIF